MKSFLLPLVFIAVAAAPGMDSHKAQKHFGKDQSMNLPAAGLRKSALAMRARGRSDAFEAAEDSLPALRETRPNEAKPTPGSVKVNPKDGLKYVWIPPGSFQMGCSPDDHECLATELPTHPVKISKGFWMGQTEVTVGAYKRFTQENKKPMPQEPNYYGRLLNSGLNNNAMPVVDVTWREADAYCAWAGGRLPSEAEWEYAGRGGSANARYGKLDDIAWFADNSGKERMDSLLLWNADPTKAYGQRLKDNGNGMHDTGLKQVNGFGLFDVLGNVWEWVKDWYDDDYYKAAPAQDPTGPSGGQFRVLRGGSWDNVAKLVRVSVRGRLGPSSKSIGLGFRCVSEQTGP